MELLRRVVDLACEVIPGRASTRTPARPVVLRHTPSGLVLTDGAPHPQPLRFPDSAAAAQFGRRFLDELDAWEPVTAADLAADLAATPGGAGSRAA